MAGLITGTLATHLEANRDTLNQRVLELQRSSAGFDPAAFTAAISELVPPVLDAVEAEGDGFGAIVAQSLVDAALELSAAGLLRGAIREAWVSLLPQLGSQLVHEPRRIVAAVSNALANLQRNPGARPAHWVAIMTELAPSTDAATFLAAGQVAAWRAGMAAYRSDALAIAHTLEPAVLQAVLGATPDQLDLMAQDPWFDPGSTSPDGVGPAVRVGAFRGFGGPFVRPPLLALLDDHVVAMDGDGEWLVFADAFGSAVVRAGGAAARAISTEGPPPVELTDIPEPLTWVVAPCGLVVSSTLSHAVVFTKVQP